MHGTYQSFLVFLSIAVAILASYTALALFDHFSTISDARLRRACLAGGALLIGAGVAAMHYVGMQAQQTASGLSYRPLWLAVSGIVLALLVMATLVFLQTRFIDRQKRSYGSSLDALNHQLIRLATLDSLTELPNRVTLMAGLEQAVERCRSNQQIFAVLFMDLDGFKTINDSLGHSVGDSLLKAYARQLLTLIPSHDMVARIGGDEFVIVVEQIAAADEVLTIADSILHKMQEHLMVDGAPMHVTPSMGIALYPRDGESVEELLKNADAAMYTAKEAGRNTYRMFESYMNESAQRAMETIIMSCDCISNLNLTVSQVRWSGLKR